MKSKMCKCGYLEYSANDPTNPIEYGEKLIPKEEITRLQKLTKNISTINDAIKILGEPSTDSTYRRLSWDSHSKVATIDIHDVGMKELFIHFQQK